MPRRKYGKNGIELSIIGFGGIVVSKSGQKHANRVVAKAVEKGINYFDVAPTYGDAELKLGPALEPYRKNNFLACKTIQRKSKPAMDELKRSLKNLRTDYFDLYQSERNAIDQLLRHQKENLSRHDPDIRGWNVGINCGETAGQTVFHAHIHLIPRREGDCPDPRGGVRCVIPGKAQY